MRAQGTCSGRCHRAVAIIRTQKSAIGVSRQTSRSAVSQPDGGVERGTTRAETADVAMSARKRVAKEDMMLNMMDQSIGGCGVKLRRE
jgi:hypothetical protein